MSSFVNRFRNLSLFTRGIYITSVASVPYFAYQTWESDRLHRERPLNEERKSLKYFWEIENPMSSTSCAHRIAGRTVALCIGFPFNQILSTETGDAVMRYSASGVYSALFGAVLGGSFAMVWPISVPLGGLYIAEKKYAIKLC